MSWLLAGRGWTIAAALDHPVLPIIVVIVPAVAATVGIAYLMRDRHETVSPPPPTVHINR